MSFSFQACRAAALSLVVCFVSIAAAGAHATAAAQRGCGILLPVNDSWARMPSDPGTASEVQRWLNGHCADWQCGRAALVSIPTLLNATTVIQAPRRACVRGASEGAPCVVSSDCYSDELECSSGGGGGGGSGGGVRVCVKKSAGEATSPVTGFVAILVATVSWGSNFIFARATKTGNGVLFQLFMCAGIAFVGFVTQVARANAQDAGNRGGFVFYPYASIGGMLWLLGNSLCIPVINLLGLGLSVAVWGATNMVFGWAASTFGFWGLTKQELARPALSYIGVVFGIISVALLACVRPTRFDNDSTASNTSSAVDDSESDKSQRTPLLQQQSAPTAVASGSELQLSRPDLNYSSAQPPRQKGDTAAASSVAAAAGGPEGSDQFPIIALVGGVARARVLGFCGAIVAGIFFGLNNIPVQAQMEQFSERSETYVEKFSPNGLDYVFSHFVGVFVSAFAILLLLALFESAQRRFPGSAIARVPVLFGACDEAMAMVWPAFLCGVGWGVAQVAAFVGNTQLGMSVSYPVVCLGPGLVASLWSLLYFRELDGRQNLVFLLLALAAGGTSSGLVVASRS